MLDAPFYFIKSKQVLRQIFGLLLVFLVPIIGYTQALYTLKGEVFDEETQTPLDGVNIYIPEIKKGTSSDGKGNFEINGLSKARYTIIFSYLGYKEVKRNIHLHNNIHLEVAMKSKNISLSEVSIVGDRYEDIENIPARITLMPVEKLENSSEQRIPDVLSNVSGIHVDNTMGVFSSKAIVNLRGISGNDQSRTLIVLDGIPMNKSDGGSVNWNLFNMETIEAVKIIKGPASARYGSNAMGGVIEVISKKPTEKFSGNAYASYGTYNTMAEGLNLYGMYNNQKGNKFYWSLNESAMKSDGYIAEIEEYMEVDDSIIVPVFLKEINATAKLGYHFKNKHNIEIMLNHFDDIRGNGIYVYDDYGAYSEHDTWMSSLKYNYFDSIFRIHADGFYLLENYQRVYEYMKEGEYMLYDVNSWREDMGVKLDFTWYKKRHTILSGIMFRQGSVDAKDTYYTSTDIISNKGEMNTYAGYIQDEIDIALLDIQLSMGLRFDIADFSNAMFNVDNPSYSIEFMTDYQDTVVDPNFWNALSPKLSVQKKFGENSRVFLAYGRGFKAPVLDDLCRTSKRSGSFKIANPELKPEFVDNIELGYDYKLFNNISVKHSLYYSIGTDFMYLVSTGDSVNMGFRIAPIYKIDNISRVHIYGIENDIEYSLSENFNAYFNYTYNISQIKDHQVQDKEADENLNGKYLVNLPNHKMGLGLVWKNKFVNVSFSGKYTGVRWINDLNEIDDEYFLTDKFPAYAIFNARFSKTLFSSLSLSASVNNIFNKIYINNRMQRCPGRFIEGRLSYKF
ncbi:MAG: hypothetical protein C0594_01085 [Marinilabiliales bacterium]|nr:MAG: hypothetical protein C0594_01085 [Marinilabiliales bacterium]